MYHNKHTQTVCIDIPKTLKRNMLFFSHEEEEKEDKNTDIRGRQAEDKESSDDAKGGRLISDLFSAYELEGGQQLAGVLVP